MDILFEKEHVRLDRLTGHGGFFKTKGVGQRMMASAMGVPVSVLETAGEGGAWGIALLASYLLYRTEGETLEDYLAGKVFGADAGESLAPDDGCGAASSSLWRATSHASQRSRRPPLLCTIPNEKG